jgi:hypothetical protein
MDLTDGNFNLRFFIPHLHQMVGGFLLTILQATSLSIFGDIRPLAQQFLSRGQFSDF